MERKALESAAANYSYLRGLLSIPVGIVGIVAALGNWKWGPLRHAWVFVACVLAAGLAGLAITRYYSEHYGDSSPFGGDTRPAGWSAGGLMSARREEIKRHGCRAVQSG